MARWILLVLVVWAAVGQAEAAELKALVGATVFDATGADPIDDAVVLIEGDRIRAVGSRADVEVPPDATVIDCSGRWIVPGLVDPHIHFFQSGSLYTRPDVIDLRHVRSYDREIESTRADLIDTFRRTLASGVTAVVDVGGPFWNFEVRKLARETRPAPRVAVAGPLVSTVSREQLDLGDPPIIKVESEEQARALVRRQLEFDPDLIKIWFIVSPDGDVEENLPIIQATVHEAHRGGKRVAIHATQLEAARTAVRVGADILVHSVDDAAVDQEFLDLLVKRGVIYTTTLVVYEGYAEVFAGAPELMEIERRLGDPRAIDSWAELAPAVDDPAERERRQARMERSRSRAATMASNLLAVSRAGITVAAGTDAGNIGTLHGPSVHREYELMAAAGLSPKQILLAATRDAARVFAVAPEFGTIEAGKLADLLLLREDPLGDVAHLQSIDRIVLGGEFYTQDQLLPPGPETVVQRQVEAYNARDLEAFLALYAEDVVIAEHPDARVIAEGQDEMREIYQKLFEDSPSLNCTILRRTVQGRMVIDQEFVTGARGRPPIRAVAMYQVEDGLIQKVWFLPRE